VLLPTADHDTLRRAFPVWIARMRERRTLSRMRRPLTSLDDLRDAARRRLPRPVFDYVDGGADDERTMQANRDAFARWSLRPRVGVDVSQRDQSVELLGTCLPSPVVLAPTALNRLLHPDGELAVARAASEFGTMFAVSTSASVAIEEIAAVAKAPLWFQLYMAGREETSTTLERVAEAGVDTLCLTLDTPVQGFRRRDVRNFLTFPPKLGGATWTAFASRPVWSFRYLTAEPVTFPNMSHLHDRRSSLNPSITWRKVSWLRGQWSGQLVVKGITRGEDAQRALLAGVDAIVVSNHGGRQLDDGIGTLDCLTDVVDAVAGRAPVLLDGGVRRGTDVLKAVALGARAVLVGRPYCYALAVGGEGGVLAALELLRDEVDRALALVGCANVTDLDRSFLTATP
jgi:isopentenyl diphosphate isomerase/L-lactate dehydrogenase-like FMN-dependent dehydrogenase